MCSRKTDKHIPSNEYDYNHQTVIVSFDIEYIPLIPNKVCRRKFFLQVSMVLPLRILHDFFPSLYRRFCVSMLSA